MSLDRLFEQIPDPGSYSFPSYSIPQGEPVMPIALTEDELETLLDLYDEFASVDPTGIDSNPFLQATNQLLKRTFATTLDRPDEQLHDDITAMLSDFSDELGSAAVGVVDATPKHHQTLYFFLSACGGYHLAPHISFSPEVSAVETLYEVFERVTEQDYYLKRPATVLE